MRYKHWEATGTKKFGLRAVDPRIPVHASHVRLGPGPRIPSCFGHARTERVLHECLSDILAWIKHFSAKEFSRERLLDESWAKEATNVAISVADEFDNQILHIDFKDGAVTT